MAQVRPIRPARLIAGLIAVDDGALELPIEPLESEFGPVDLRSGVIPFDFTDYYEKEMGARLKRQLTSFERLIDPAALADAKLFTNGLEMKLAAESPDGPKRRVNIDPGYLTEAKLVLASAKDFSHRIYLRDGIFAEVTLHFRKGDWHPWPWTFPDYATEPYRAFFREARARFREQIRAADRQ